MGLPDKALRYTGGLLLGSTAGGVLGNSVSDFITKGEEKKLKSLSNIFLIRLKRQPRMYSLYNRITQKVKTISVLPSGDKKDTHKKDIVLMTQQFVSGLTETDMKLYLKIQKLTDKIYSIQRTSISTGVTVGGVIGLILAGNLKK
jgi:hypothetical protein